MIDDLDADRGPRPEATTGFRATVERFADRLVPRRLAPWREQLQYLVVGGWNTLFGYALFVVLYTLFRDRLPVTVILVVGYAIGVANNYIIYKVVVFRSHAAVWREFPRFSLVYLVTLAVNLVALPLALHLLPLSAYVLQAAFTLIVVVVTYGANKYFSFRPTVGAPPSG